MTFKREPNTEYILSLSYGKDSLACLEAIKQLGYPLDRIVHVEVWATDTIPADLPPMVEFKKKADEIILNRYGIKVEHVCATRAIERERERESETPDSPERITKDCSTLDLQRENTRVKYMDSLKPLERGVTIDSKSLFSKKLKLETYEEKFYRVAQSGRRTGEIWGFPMSIGGGNWCNKLKTKPFRRAPLHKERRKILCSIWV